METELIAVSAKSLTPAHIGVEMFVPGQGASGVLSDLRKRWGRVTLYVGGTVLTVSRGERVVF